jgi:polysaccharide biosynthesis transport protein
MNAFSMSRVAARTGYATPVKPTRDRAAWSFGRIVQILARRVRAIAIITCAALTLASAYLVVAQPKYRATASLMPDLKRNPAAPGEVPADSLIDPAIVDSQIEIVRSQSLALAVVDKLSLSDDPEFTGRGRIARLIRTLTSERPKPVDPEVLRHAAAAAFAHNLSVARVGRSYLTEVSFTSMDPVKAAGIANEVTNQYIQGQLDAKIGASERSKRWMQQRLDELGQRVAAASKAIEQFKAANDLQLDDSGKPVILKEKPDLEHALSQARLEISRLKSRYEVLQTALGHADPNTVPTQEFFDQVNDASLRRAANAFNNLQATSAAAPGDEGATSEALTQQRTALWSAIRNLDAATKTDLDAAQVREAAIIRRIDELGPRLEAAQSLLAKLDRLTQQLQSSQQLQDSLRNRFARMAEFLQQQSVPVTEARVISAAEKPLKPSAPKALLVVILALPAGAIIAIGYVLTAEYLDRTVRRSEQIAEELGLRPLGSIPCTSLSTASPRTAPGITGDMKKAPTAFSRHVEAWLSGPAGETVRYVKAIVDQKLRKKDARSLAVVAPRSGEGKSAIALGLAAIAARGGQRVLLIDADVHDPVLTRALGSRASAHGSQLSRARDPHGMSDCELGFQFMTLSDVPHRYASEILASATMQQLVDRIRGEYDYIIFDTPPLLLHVDVVAAAELFDALIMTAECGSTTLDDITCALDRSTLLSDRVLGVLVNKTAPRPSSGRALATRLRPDRLA